MSEAFLWLSWLAPWAFLLYATEWCEVSVPQPLGRAVGYYTFLVWPALYIVLR